MSDKVDHANRPPADTRCIPSDQLLGRLGQVWIEHQGQRYLLRTTASNKLILTK